MDAWIYGKMTESYTLTQNRVSDNIYSANPFNFAKSKNLH